MSFTVIIPARYGSQRLPGKPLLDLAGQTMIERVYRCAQQSDATRVVVATDHQDIFDVVMAFGGEAVMTSSDHQSGTDRLAEVVTQLKLLDDDVVVNVQGDEPLMPAVVINQVADNLCQHDKASAATLSEPVHDVDNAFNPNAVKVVCNLQGMAMYFSRASIPWNRDAYSQSPPHMINDGLMQRHIGIYAYKVGLLKAFVTWPMSALEKVEKLEQLRILDHGHFIHVEPAMVNVPAGIDTPDDLERVSALLIE